LGIFLIIHRFEFDNAEYLFILAWSLLKEEGFAIVGYGEDYHHK